MATRAVPTSPYFRLEALAPGVYAAIATPGSGAMANAGIIDLGGATVVFDTLGTLGAAKDLRQCAERLTGRPVTCVVNSHEHMEHVHGNQIFAEAEIVTTVLTRELMAVNRPAFLRTAKEYPSYPYILEQQAAQEPNLLRRKELTDLAGDFRALQVDLPHLRVQFPTITFQKRATIHGSKRTVELHTLSGGHSPSDTFLSLPAERIAFMGDLLHVNVHPPLRFGNPAEWVRILDQIGAFKLDIVVPGHGPVGGPSHLLEQRQYLQWIMEHAADLAKTDGDETEAKLPPAYATWESPSVFYESLKHLLYHRSQLQTPPMAAGG